MKNSLVICSSANGRGIHRYAQGLQELIDPSEIIEFSGKRLGVVWEMAGILVNVPKLREARRVVFANSRISPLLLLILRKSDLFVVIHDLMDTSDGDSNARNKSLIDRVRDYVNGGVMRLSCNSSSGVIVNSYSTLEELRWQVKWKPRKVAVIYPRPSFSLEEILETNANEGGQSYILAVTGKSRNKNYMAYYRLAELLYLKFGKNIQLKVVGNEYCDLNEYYKAKVDRRGVNVRLFSYVRNIELAEMYAGCVAFVSLSTREGFGIPLDDALGFGIPSFSTKIAAYYEVSKLHSERYHVMTEDEDLVAYRLVEYLAVNRNEISRDIINDRIKRYTRHLRVRGRDRRAQIRELFRTV